VQVTRYIWFGLSILLGLLVGLFLGNRFMPVPYENVPMSSLRDDYKADYVFMVAESYQKNQNINQAAEAVQRLGTETPFYLAQQALLTARNLNYPQADIELMRKLADALQKVSVTPGATP
jgi:hypothetical protein